MHLDQRLNWQNHIMATSENLVTSSNKLQNNIILLENWLSKWRIKANASKSVKVTFTLRKDFCPTVALNNNQLPQADHAKYFLYGQTTYLAKTYFHKAQTTVIEANLIILVHWSILLAISSEHGTHIQSHNKTYLVNQFETYSSQLNV